MLYQGAGVPSGVVVSAGTFEDAQRTVEHLRSYGMRPAELEITGADLRLAQKVQAVSVVRLTATSALYGACLGLLAGVFITLVAETSLTGLAVVVWGFVYGVLVGALWGLFRGLVRNRPDAVTTEVVPTRYEVRCPVEELSVARRLLSKDDRAEQDVTAEVHEADAGEADQKHAA